MNDCRWLGPYCQDLGPLCPWCIFSEQLFQEIRGFSKDNQGCNQKMTREKLYFESEN